MVKMVKMNQIRTMVVVFFCSFLVLMSAFASSTIVLANTNGNLPSIVCIDTPTSNYKSSGNTLNVSGWSLDESGVKQVQVSVDNGTAKNADIGEARLDVDMVYPGYTGGKNSGYSTSLDISALSIGAHTVTVNSTGNDGVVTSKSVNIYKVPVGSSNMTQYVDIDTPSNNSYILSDDTLNVGGWSLNGYGVQKVQVYVDNGSETDATIGVPRLDVDKAFPGYVGGTTSGYNASVKLPTLSDGVHTIKVVSIGNDGSIATGTANIIKVSEQSMPGMVCIDTPNYSQINAKQIQVSGWSLSLYGVTRVQVSVDNGAAQDATIGIARQDVAAAYPAYEGGSQSGFVTNVDISKLSTGVHTITVTSTSKDGIISKNSTQIYVIPEASSDLSSMVDVDSPSNDVFIEAQNSMVNVTGWSLDAFGVQKVQIYVDNIYNGDATSGMPRTDVDQVYPGYMGGVNSGYTYTMNISSLSYGAHDISVRSLGNDGITTSKDLVIYKVYNNTNVASKIVSFLNVQSNLDTAEKQALQLHSGVASDNCVYFSSSVLRDIGISVPMNICNTQHYVPFITAQGWTKDYNVNDLYPGNICFTVSDGTGYSTHTYIFMGWVNPFDHTLAYVADNQSNTIHIRSMIDAPNTDAFSFGFHN
jgi:copper chaperone CopZ